MYILLTNAATGRKILISANLILAAQPDNETVVGVSASMIGQTKVTTGIQTSTGVVQLKVKESPEEIGMMINNSIRGDQGKDVSPGDLGWDSQTLQS